MLFAYESYEAYFICIYKVYLISICICFEIYLVFFYLISYFSYSYIDASIEMKL